MQIFDQLRAGQLAGLHFHWLSVLTDIELGEDGLTGGRLIDDTVSTFRFTEFSFPRPSPSNYPINRQLHLLGRHRITCDGARLKVEYG